MSELLTKAKLAKQAAGELVTKTTAEKNAVLEAIGKQLVAEMDYLLAENKRDIEAAIANGTSSSLIDRLTLTEARIRDMAEAMTQLIALPDPVGDVLETIQRPNGLHIEQVRVPLGVVGMIYEARPNVTVDAATLCLKTGNAVILRGSSSASYSNQALVHVIHRALEQTAIPAAAVQLIEDTSRKTAAELFTLNEYLDVLIPRGGKQLIQTVVAQSSVPVLETGAGNCHIFIDESAEEQMTREIVLNAKVQRPSVCNAIETILVHEAWAHQHLPVLAESLIEKGVELRGDEAARALVPAMNEATESDWEEEYNDLILAVKLVASTEEAIAHINRYGTKHSEAILTNHDENVARFFTSVDAAALYHNASTRFTDGFEFGFGAEIGISTQKLHARGPMGLPALTSTKYIVRGTGQIR